MWRHVRILLLALVAGDGIAQPATFTYPGVSAIVSPLRYGLFGCWSMEEATGATRYDMSPSGEHLQSVNGVAKAAGVSTYTGSCAQFTQASHMYLLGSTNTGAIANEMFSVSAWYYRNATGDQAIVGKWDDSPSNFKEWLIYYSTSLGRLQFYMSNNGSSAASVTATNFGVVPTLTWMHIYAWYDKTNINISVNNGAPDSTPYTLGCNKNNSFFKIGAMRQPVVTVNWVGGFIDEVELRKGVVLSDADRTQLYHTGLGTHFPWAHP